MVTLCGICKVNVSRLHAIKVYEKVEVWVHAFLIPAVDGDEGLVSRPGRFTPKLKRPSTQLNRRLHGPPDSPDVLKKKRVS